MGNIAHPTRAVVLTPFGPVTLVEDRGLLVRLDWRDDPGEGSALLDDATRQAFSPGLAILSAQHEAQYSRLFRS